MTNDVAHVMSVYRRCKRWNTLPAAGGIMDQDERLMSLLDVVESVVEELRDKRIENERNEMTRNQMLSQMRPDRA